METLPVKLLSRYAIAANTMAFELEKPEGYTFVAGQHTVVSLPELRYDDKRGSTRPFTIASAPGADTILLVTRQTGSGFKKTWQELPLGSEIQITKASGDLVLEENEPAVFITGGIGITPFRSMILDIYHRQLDTPVHLFYSNKNAEAAAFHSFFTRLTKDFDALEYVPTMTEINHYHNDWNGEKRKIDESFIRDYVQDIPVPFYYISGPPSMVTDLSGILETLGIEKEKVKTESFYGYD